MAIPVEKQIHKFSYKDYQTWPDDERWELIDGTAYDMSPAPSTSHQEILREFFGTFWLFFKGKPCKVFIAPFDVRLPETGEDDDDITTVVQPDLSVICDPFKLDEKGAKGAPELILEVLSPGTAKKDINEKLALYEKHKVKEYWIADPLNKMTEVFILDQNGQYSKPFVYNRTDKIETLLFPGLVIDLVEIFGKDTDA